MNSLRETMRSRKSFPFHAFVVIGILWSATLWAQTTEEEEQAMMRRTSAIPKAVDFSRLFEQEEITREDFEDMKARRAARVQERFTQLDALETAVDPSAYVVGPGDFFSFNVWGAVEGQYPVEISPEGKLLIPSVGAIEVSGRYLDEVQRMVLEAAASPYEKSELSLTLESLRFFRVHVVGEVEYPGTYVAQAVDRVSELIADAGGVTERAWKREVEVSHADGKSDVFDLDAFEAAGDLTTNRFVNGGDVIFVPSIGVGINLVQVEGDLLNSGSYRIYPEENLLSFLDRIRVLKRNTDLSKIVVVRSTEPAQRFMPFHDEADIDFQLQDGDHIVIPTNYVYVKGAVRMPGAYPFVLNLTAKDYAGMAGGDYRSGTIKSCRVYHVRTGETENGPDVFVEAGDVVHLKPALNVRVREYLQLFTALTSLFLAANAAGLFGE